MKNLIILVSSGLLFASCAQKVKVMDVSVVSMTHTHLPPAAKLQEKGPVTGSFCADSSKDKGHVGLFDEAIKSAQSLNSVDFITNVSFWRDEHGCILLEGTGQKIVAENAATEVKSETSGAKKSRKTIKK
jgi:hypothetical protein